MTMKNDCVRVSEIWSRTDEEDSPGGRDEEFVEQHLQTCERCCRTHEILKGYADNAQEYFDEPLDDLAARKWVDQVITREKASRSTPSPAARSVWPLVRIVFASGAVAAAVAIIVVFVFGGEVDDKGLRKDQITNANGPADRLQDPVAIAGKIRSINGEVLLEGQAAAVGATLKEGDHISAHKGNLQAHIGGRATISLRNKTEVKLSSVTDDRIEIDLIFGRIRSDVDSQKDGPDFSISTRKGVVVVTGTEFEVRDVNGEVVVEVYRGSVRVEERDMSPRRIAAGEGTSLTGEGLVFSLEETPKELKQEQARAVSTGKKAEEQASNKTKTPLPKVNAGELLRQAHDLRSKGQWTMAADAYEKIIATFPQSFEAQSSRISVGLLYLDRLRMPAKALTMFDSYLGSRSSAPLAQEAAFGKARAFRAMGNTVAEMDTLEKFLEAYPAAIQTTRIRARLESLRSISEDQSGNL